MSLYRGPLQKISADRWVETYPARSFPALPDDARLWVSDHRLAVRQGHPHGRLHRTPRRLDPFRGQTAHRIPTPLVPGRGRHGTLRRQRPPGRTPLRLGARTVEKGLHELHHGVRCLENFAARGRQRSEEKDPQLAADIRAIVEPHTHADPGTEVGAPLHQPVGGRGPRRLDREGLSRERLPSERTMRDILNRMNYRLKRIQKGKPLKKTKETDAIFANVQAVREQVRDDPRRWRSRWTPRRRWPWAITSWGEKPGRTPTVR